MFVVLKETTFTSIQFCLDVCSETTKQNFLPYNSFEAATAQLVQLRDY